MRSQLDIVAEMAQVVAGKRLAADVARERARDVLAMLPGPLGHLLAFFFRILLILNGIFTARDDRFILGFLDLLLRCPPGPIRKFVDVFKALGLLVVLGDVETRRQLYEAAGVSLPSQVEDESSSTAWSLEPALGQKWADQADYVIVGTGPAGATVGRALALAGEEVLFVEEGKEVPKNYQAPNTATGLQKLWRQSAMQATTPPEMIPVLQGVCVGGSSVINSAIVHRAPEDVFADWHDDAHLAEVLTLERIDKAYAAIEAAMGIEQTAPSIYGANNELFLKAAEVMNISAQPMRRYTPGCEGLGRCMEGCPRGHKLGMHMEFIPTALEHGGRLYSRCCVERVLFEGERAVGVVAKYGKNKVRFGARKAVIIAASAIQTPIILQQSSVRKKAVGERFQVHPGSSLTGIFDQPIRSPIGATQGAESIHFRKTRRLKFETLSLPDELFATRFPGFGRALWENVQEVPNACLWAALVRAKAHGKVRPGLFGPRIQYRMTAQDQATLGEGLKFLAEMYFAVGAREVFPSVAGYPERITSLDALKGIENGVHPKQLNMIASHLFGTAFMGSDSADAVCDAWGQVHGFEGLYVADSALFPTNLGVNPQHTIMMLAQHVAWGLLER